MVLALKIGGFEKMDKVSLSIIIEEFTNIHDQLYDENIDPVDASFKLGKVIDDLNGWMDYLPESPQD